MNGLLDVKELLKTTREIPARVPSRCRRIPKRFDYRPREQGNGRPGRTAALLSG
jgi:hypothetical protein